ncbi:general secretion pathway protein GspB [Allohahella marinimesophila]|uniref:Type II secretion system protein GspB C-terminal domain-containing protein n=1 Tax=Allohahella marinimesophila TaxID=1054972 RepID=A0ABP7NXU8_9GAMM
MRIKRAFRFRLRTLPSVGVLALGLMCIPISQAAEAPPASKMIEGMEIQDPTRPLNWRAGPRAASSAAVARPKLAINSILISSARRLAIINGRSVAEGDTIEGVKVQRVSADGVRLSWQGQQWTARLSTAGGAVRKPSRTQP